MSDRKGRPRGSRTARWAMELLLFCVCGGTECVCSVAAGSRERKREKERGEEEGGRGGGEGSASEESGGETTPPRGGRPFLGSLNDDNHSIPQRRPSVTQLFLPVVSWTYMTSAAVVTSDRCCVGRRRMTSSSPATTTTMIRTSSVQTTHQTDDVCLQRKR